MKILDHTAGSLPYLYKFAIRPIHQYKGLIRKWSYNGRSYNEVLFVKWKMTMDSQSDRIGG